MPSDWSGSGFITFEINSSTTHRFELNLYDAGGVRSLEILPFQNVWVRASIPLIHFQKMNTEGMDQASIWKTPRPGYWIGFTGAVGSINNIDSLGVAMNHADRFTNPGDSQFQTDNDCRRYNFHK